MIHIIETIKWEETGENPQRQAGLEHSGAVCGL